MAASAPNGHIGSRTAPARTRAAYVRARVALEELKGQHNDQAGEWPIPLVCLGVDETGTSGW
jgi:hypothetical protein